MSELRECPYCNSDNPGVRDTFFDQSCSGCVQRMARSAGFRTMSLDEFKAKTALEPKK